MVIRIQNAEHKESKNSLFTILILISIPSVLILLITPIVVLGGDKNLSAEYKLLFIILSIITIIAVYYIQTRRKIN
jgi:type VI protein secretion system component VasK